MKRSYFGETARYLAWTFVAFVVGVIVLNVIPRQNDEQPLPRAPSTSGACDWEDASPEWWADANCTGHDPVNVPEPSPKLAPTPAFQEDEPGWDCLTQGNHICGPVTTEPLPNASEYADLELCQYAYLHGYTTATEYLSCTSGLHADESRSTNYAWETIGPDGRITVRTDPELERRLGR